MLSKPLKLTDNLPLNVPPTILDAHVGPDPDIKDGSPDHLWVKGSHLPPNVDLKLVQGQWLGGKYRAFEYAPYAKVQGVEVRRAGGPGPASDTLPRHQSPIKLVLQVGDVATSGVAGCPVLGKPQPGHK